MNQTEAIEVGRDTLLMMLKIGGPVLLAALVIGLAVALFQALTQMQEMTLAFVPKIIVVVVSVILLAPFMVNQLVAFTQELADRIVSIG